jgi:BlaI family transcriptional regulator, penicillinase repressor
LPTPRLAKLEFRIMEVLWEKGDSSVREIVDSLSLKRRPAYTTIQSTLYRMETKGVVHRPRKIGNFHIFAAKITRDAAQRRLIDDLLELIGGRPQPLMAHLVKTGKLSLNDVKEAEEALKGLSSKENRP